VSEGVWCWDEHEWIDFTALGDAQPTDFCAKCGVRVVRPVTWKVTTDGYVETMRLPGQLRGVHGLSFAA